MVCETAQVLPGGFHRCLVATAASLADMEETFGSDAHRVVCDNHGGGGSVSGYTTASRKVWRGC